MIIKPIKTRVFIEGENLIAFITKYIKRLPEQAVLVVTSKIVSLAEKRTAVVENIQTKVELIRKESQYALPTEHVWLTIKDGIVMATAGIDESNANGKLILLPKDSFKSAYKLRMVLKRHYKVKNLGILITDSRTIPLRAGVTGVAVGYAGFKGIKSYVGNRDIYGRKFKFERTNVADSLATAAVLTMGEGNEQQPLAIMAETSVKFCDKIKRKELRIDIQDDMYRPLFDKLPPVKK